MNRKPELIMAWIANSISIIYLLVMGLSYFSLKSGCITMLIISEAIISEPWQCFFRYASDNNGCISNYFINFNTLWYICDNLY